MGKSNALKVRTSNVSSAAKPSTISESPRGSKSSILRSSFSPSHFQLSLFASVIRGFDSEHLRIHDTQTGRLRCDHAISLVATVTCLDWGHYGQEPKNGVIVEETKKRKRSDRNSSNASSDRVTIAFGTSSSQVHFYSPTEAKTLGVLKGGHTHGIRDFKFADEGLTGHGWSIGGDSKLVQWDLRRNIQLRNLKLPDASINTIQPSNSSFLCASHLAYSLDLDSQREPFTFNASTNPVRFIVVEANSSSPGPRFLTAAQNDRYLNVFNADSQSLVGSLRTESEVIQAGLAQQRVGSPNLESGSAFADRLVHPANLLAIINSDGILEIFPEPFNFPSNVSQFGQDSTRARMKQCTRKSAAQVKFCRPTTSTHTIPLINLSLQGNYITVAWAEGGVHVVFETLKLQDEATGALLFDGSAEVVKEKSASGVQAALTEEAKNMHRAHVDESHTVITNGFGGDDALAQEKRPEVINISSGEEGNDSSDGEVAYMPQQSTNTTSVSNTNKKAYNDVDMVDADSIAPISEGNGKSLAIEEPSFGDLLRVNAPEPIDVVDSFPDSNQQRLVPAVDASHRQLPSGMSLGTVLTQSLRTNDRNLLQTCFHVPDLSIVRATIERLDSAFAPALLQRLAERLHSRPGRAGSLMVWIQWTLIAHGGFLASRPDAMENLRSLHRVVKERANSLHFLLSLKGKLDLLEAQMNLRKSMQKRVRGHMEEDEEAVVYVEGQDESDFDQHETEGEMTSESEDDKPQAEAGAKAQYPLRLENTLTRSSDIDSETDMPKVNGVLSDSDDAGSESDKGDVFDEEPLSTDRDSGDDISDEDVDHDDIDTRSSDGEASPPPKRLSSHSTAGRAR